MIEYLSSGWSGADAQGFTEPGWYFWDETQAYCHGPYDTKREAALAMKYYGDSL